MGIMQQQPQPNQQPGNQTPGPGPQNQINPGGPQSNQQLQQSPQQGQQPGQTPAGQQGGMGQQQQQSSQPQVEKYFICDLLIIFIFFIACSWRSTRYERKAHYLGRCFGME